MVSIRQCILLSLAIAGLAACQPSPGAPEAAASGQVAASEPYLSPPRPDTVVRDARGWSLAGSGPERSKARLATPNGQVITGNVDKHGRWIMPLGEPAQPLIFGLSTASGARTVQAEGYVLVAPGGKVALLRAGAGAVRIDRPGPTGLRTLDFDRQGGAVVSAAAPPGTAITVRVDGHPVAQGRADASGRCELSLPPTSGPGDHRLQLVAGGVSDTVTLQFSPAAPLAHGPVRSQLTTAGLRIDWMTPGGGVQSTILIH